MFRREQFVELEDPNGKGFTVSGVILLGRQFDTRGRRTALMRSSSARGG